jgi:hypothetical protein
MRARSVLAAGAVIAVGGFPASPPWAKYLQPTLRGYTVTQGYTVPTNNDVPKGSPTEANVTFSCSRPAGCAGVPQVQEEVWKGHVALSFLEMEATGYGPVKFYRNGEGVGAQLVAYVWVERGFGFVVMAFSRSPKAANRVAKACAAAVRARARR